MKRQGTMDKPYKQIVTVFVRANREPDEVFYQSILINCSDGMSFGFIGSDMEILDEAIRNWFYEIEEHVKTEARFELALQRETEGLEAYYDVTCVDDVDGVLPRGAP